MACTTFSRGITKHLKCEVVNVIFYEPFTTWYLCTGVDEVRGLIKAYAATSNFKYKLAYQVALCRTDKPEDWAVLEAGAYHADDGEYCSGDVSVATATAAAFFIRFGVAYQFTSGTTAEADVEISVSFDACGTLLGTTTVTLQSTMPASEADRMPKSTFAGEIGLENPSRYMTSTGDTFCNPWRRAASSFIYASALRYGAIDDLGTSCNSGLKYRIGPNSPSGGVPPLTIRTYYDLWNQAFRPYPDWADFDSCRE